MGSPLLGWPSTPSDDGGAVVFAAGTRPLDFGYLLPAWRDNYGHVIYDAEEKPSTAIAKGAEWQFRFALAFDLQLVDQREWLRPVQDGYMVQLLVGADDGAARTYEVDIDWNGNAATAQDALDSVEVAVREK